MLTESGVMVGGLLPPKPPGQRFNLGWADRYILADTQTAVVYPIDESAGVTIVPMLGDGHDPTLTVNGGVPMHLCGPAAVAHLRIVLATMAGVSEGWPTADQTADLYLQYTGGKDTGVSLADFLLWLFHQNKILGFAPVDHTSRDACARAMLVGHGVLVGANLLDGDDALYLAQKTWDLIPGQSPDPGQGHCMIWNKTDGSSLDTFLSWTAPQAATVAWTAQCVAGAGEAWLVVTSEDQAAKMDMPALTADITALGGTQ